MPVTDSSVLLYHMLWILGTHYGIIISGNMTGYYSMSLKKLLRINGEAGWPEVTAMKFGIEGTGCLQMIKTTIDHVRSCKE